MSERNMGYGKLYPNMREDRLKGDCAIDAKKLHDHCDKRQ